MKRTPTAMVALATLATTLTVTATGSVGASSPSRTECIVSLSPSATETLFAIGAGKSVEAVDTDSNYPTHGLPSKRLDPFNPSAEQIATICKVTVTHKTSKPDLVVVSYDANSIVEKLRALSVHVLVQDAPGNLSGAYSQMTELGAATGHVTAAAAVVAALKATVKKDVASIPAHRGKVVTAYYELDPTLYSLTSSTFVGTMLKSLGVLNIADAVAQPTDDDYPQLTAEYLVSASPRAVFLADAVCCHATAATFALRPGFSTISAVRHHHVTGLNDDVASRWGPRLGILMGHLAAGVRSTLVDKSVWKK